MKSPGLRGWTILAALAIAAAAGGQTLEVTHNVNLRQDPSTDNPPIRLVLVGEHLTLLEPGKTNDYYHVTTEQNEEGWTWSHNVRMIEATATPTPAITATPTPTVFAAT